MYFCNRLNNINNKTMQDYTLSIPENNSKAKALLNYLKSIDFVKISKRTDWWDGLTVEQQDRINKSADLIDVDEGISHENVMEKVNALLNNNA